MSRGLRIAALISLASSSCNAERVGSPDAAPGPERPGLPSYPGERRDGGAAGGHGALADASTRPGHAGSAGNGSGGSRPGDAGFGGDGASGETGTGAAAHSPGGGGVASSGGTSSGGAASGGSKGGQAGQPPVAGAAQGGSTNAGGSEAGAGAGGVEPGPPGILDLQVQLASQVDVDAPATVGIVTFRVNAPDVTRAHVDFGLDEGYGTRVEVDLDAPEYRTLLLGMKPTRTYHFRVTAETSLGTFESADQTLETGVIPWTAVGAFNVLNAERREPGFVLGSFWRGLLGTRIFVIDPDGELVWYADVHQSGVARAAPSMDGKSLWVVSINNQGSPLKRVTWDGLVLEDYIAIGSHDIVAVEDDLMAYIDYADEGCESIVEIDPDGVRTKVFDLDAYLVRSDALTCHGNALRYSRARDSYILSSLLEDVFIVPRDGGAVTRLSELVPGGNLSWGGTQHGVDFLGESLLIFANDEGDPVGGFQSGGPSTVIEYSLLDGAELWRHEAELYTANLGGVQRLPGGNTWITYSNPGVIREVTPDGETVLEIQGVAMAFGYSTWLRSLYDMPEEVFTVLR